MGVYENHSGVLTPIAGRGKAEYGASTVRTGTATIPQSSAGALNVVSVTFDTPMPDNDYLVTFECSTSAIDLRLVSFDKTASGFSIGYYASAATSAASTVKYTAFKLYTDNQYNELLTLPDEISAIRKDDLSGMHNYVRYPYDDGASKSINGIDFSEEDGIVTMDGTTTAQASYYFVNGQATNYYPDDDYRLPPGDYILRVQFSQDPASAGEYQVYINKANKDDQPALGTLVSSWQSNVDKPFTVDYDGYTTLRIGITLANTGVTVDHVTVKVLIRRADDPDTEWSIFTPSNKYLYENSYGLLSKDFSVIFSTPKAVTDENFDLDDLWPGMYRVGPLCPNSPVASINAWCDVMTVRQSANPEHTTWGYGYQIAVVTTTAYQGRVYVRSVNNGTWNAWKRQLSTSDIVELPVQITKVPISAGQTEIVLNVPNVPTGYKLLSISGFETGRVDSLRVYGCYIYSNNPSTRTFKVRIPLYAGAAIPELNGYVGVLAIPAD